MPSSPASFTSQNVAWQAPQKSTEAAGSSFAGFMIASSAAPSFFCSSASTCLRPGPWQASQVMPRMSPFVSNTPDVVDAVLWQAKQRRASASGIGRAIASARSLGALIARAGVKSAPWPEK